MPFPEPPIIASADTRQTLRIARSRAVSHGRALERARDEMGQGNYSYLGYRVSKGVSGASPPSPVPPSRIDDLRYYNDDD